MAASPGFLHRLGIATAAGALACSRLLLAPPAAAAADVPNPHDTALPGYCLNCHTEAVYEHHCDDPAGFCLLADSVDALCLLCHIRENCCRTGQDHQRKLFIGVRSHASGLEVASVRPRYRPTTLPVHNGRITCRTCHLHARLAPDGYKLLRIVSRRGDRVDWTGLCLDCHEENS